MKVVKQTIGTIVALSLMCLSAAFAGAENKSSTKNGESALDRNSKVVVAASALSSALSADFTSVVNLMTDEAKKDWSVVFSPFNVDGSQLLAPDFCKVKYMMVSKADENGYVAGFYNPFYDSFLLFLMDDVSKARIRGVRLVTKSSLEGTDAGDGLPAANGNDVAVDYFPALAKQVESAMKTFRSKFGGDFFRKEFSVLSRMADVDRTRIKKINESRIAAAILMTRSTQLRQDSVKAMLAVKNDAMDNFLGSDGSTKLTRKKLSELPVSIRKSLGIVSWFVSGNSRNILFASPRLPSLLILVHVEPDSKMWMRMFDAHSAGTVLNK